MNAHETRVSQPFHGVEGLADSHTNLIPSEEAGRFPAVTRQAICTNDSNEVAPAGEAPSTSGSLSEAQRDAFWDGIVANLDAAGRIARRYVSKQNIEDVVHTAAVLFVEDAQRSTNPEPFPKNKDRFRRKFLKTVKNHAINWSSDGKRHACPVHSHWGIDPEPDVKGRHLADRELDTLFARNDRGTYDAPAPTVRRAKDDLNGLHSILRNHMEDLSETEREIIHDTYFEEQSRKEIAARRGISLNTYDNHRKAACRKLRDSMMAVVDFCSDIDLPDWYDRLEDMNKRHAARQRRRASRKKENRSKSEGDRSKSEGDRDENGRAPDLSIAVTTKS